MALNWCDIPYDIVDEIWTRLDSVGDAVRFGGVCHSWWSYIAAKKKEETPTPKPWAPWIMLPEEEEEEEKKEETPTRFYDISAKQIIHLQLPEAHGGRWWGSPQGWLLTIGTDLNIYLLNPLNRCKIPLPPQPTFQDAGFHPHQLRRLCIRNFCLSSRDPTTTTTNSPARVMVNYGRRPKVAIATPGDTTCWATVKDSSRSSGYDHIIYFNHLFYLVDGVGNLNYCDPIDPEILRLMPPPPLPPFAHRYNYVDYFLVEISGDLCIVVRLSTQDDNVPPGAYRLLPIYFHVFRVDLSAMRWVRLTTLGNSAVFLGPYNTFAISTSCSSQLKANAIYFTDDYVDDFEHGYDIGLFDFSDKKMCDPFYSGKDSISKFSEPLFCTPNLY